MRDVRVYSLLERVKAIVGGNEIRPRRKISRSKPLRESIPSISLSGIWYLDEERGVRLVTEPLRPSPDLLVRGRSLPFVPRQFIKL